MAQQTINIGAVANDGTGDPLRTAFDKANDNFTDLYAGAGGVADDSITYAKLGTEFTTKTFFDTGANLDFSSAQTFAGTLAADTTFTFSNQGIGMVKDLIVTGDYVLTLPAGSTVAGEYDGTVDNLIQILVTDTGQFWYSISQPQ